MATVRVSDRPEASAQAATSTCVHVDSRGGLRKKKPGKVVERFPGPPRQDWPVSACFEPETLAPTSGEERETTRGPDREGQHTRQQGRVALVPGSTTPIGLCQLSRESWVHVMCLSPHQAFLRTHGVHWQVGWTDRV